MKKLALAVTCLLAAQGMSAYAQDHAEIDIKKNTLVTDADGRKVGKIRAIDQEAGFVVIIANLKSYRVPIDSLSPDGSRLQTSFTKKQLGL